MTDLVPTILASLDRRQPVALVTVVAASGTYAAQLGRHMVIWLDDEHLPVGDFAWGDLDEAIQRDTQAALRERQHCTYRYETDSGTVTIFVEVQLPPPHLVIAGAGHIAVPLATMAHLCDFVVSVLDDRPQFASRQRFPTADHVIAGPLRHGLRSLRRGALAFDADTYFVLVTRGHQYDIECLLEILADPAAYIGMIGSQRRIRAVYELLEREQGIPADSFDRIRAPVGIDIGAQTPAEIAVCIMAEIINTMRGGPALSMNEQIRRERAARRAHLDGRHDPA